MKKIAIKIFSILLLVCAGFLARAADIIFTVNLNNQIAQGQFTVGIDQIRVLGSFSSTGVLLSDSDGDKIYSATVTGFTSDSEITYNFRITRGGASINESIAARKYVVQPNTNANFIYNWFNNQLPSYPYARFFASTEKAISGEVVRFFEESEGGTATSWSWTFAGGNPSTSTEKNPTVVFSAAGSHTIVLTASNASGSSVSKTLTVTVSTVDERLGWWNDQVFYHVYPWSFLDTDGNGTGDIRGIINKLDYLNDGNAGTSTDLGVTALYIMPVHPATNVNYGGYEITDYKAILAQLGTQADFDELVTKAHQRGMKVIMDEVFNHTSSEHSWFQQAKLGTGSKYEQYYVFNSTNGPTPWGWRNNTASTNPNFKYWWSQFNGEFTADLNFKSQSARNAIKDIASHWLAKSVDGFRIDAPIYFYGSEDGGANVDRPETFALTREWNAHIKSIKPDVFSVGESWFEGCYTGKTDQLVSTAAKYTYQGFDIGFQFNVAYGIQEALNTENKVNIVEPMEAAMKYYPFLQFGVFHSNHDTYDMCAGNYEQKRLKDRLTNNQDNKLKLAAAIVLTAPGVPFIYYGDEVGAAGGGGYSARKPMQWTSGTNAGFTTGTPHTDLGPNFQTYNVATETADANSFLSLHRNLIKVRLQEKALRRGDYKTVQTSSNSVYSFVRSYGSEIIFVIFNLSPTAQSNVALTLNGSGIPSNTYTLNNLMVPSQVANAVNVAGGNISNWIPFTSIPGNAFYIVKLNNQTGGPNSTPTIDVIANATFNLENGVQTVGITGITDGNFCSQVVTVTSTSSNTGVVAVPAVSYTSCNPTGNLTLTPVAVGTSSISVTVKDNGGVANGGVDTKMISFTATVTDIPKAPTTLLLTPLTSSSITLSWIDNSTRESNYRIYWSTTTTKPGTPNATVGANIVTYAASGLTKYNTYYFWVEAYSTGGSSSAITANQYLTPPNVALNKTATASSYETYSGHAYIPGEAVDGVDNTFTNRWSTPTNGSQTQVEWIKIDLQANYALDKIKISWENANADSYYIMTSSSNITPDPNNAAWSKVNITGKANAARVDDQTVTLSGRYLAIYCYHKSHSYGYSIYELQAFGDPATGNQPPSANAGVDQSLAFGTTSTTLSGSGSDPEGSALTYSWTKISGSAVTFSNATIASPGVTRLTNGSTYVFQLSVSDGALSSTDQVQVIVANNTALPSPWVSADIGAVAATGSATHSSGTFTINASGADVYDFADEFLYLYQPYSGDVTITARVNSLTNTNAWAKAGVMLRESLGAGSSNATLLITPSNGINFQNRAATSASSINANSTSGAAPYWLRLRRTGNAFTSFYSTNGSSWTQLGSVNVTMATSIYVGLFATSHNDGTLTTATFDNVTISTTTNNPPIANAGIDQTLAAGTTSVTLNASASADPDGNAITYAWTKISGPAATITSALSVSTSVTGLTNGGIYVFQVSVSDGSLSTTDQVQVVVSVTGGVTSYYIINRWQGTYLYDDNQQVKYAATPNGTTYQWVLEDVSGAKRIKNVSTGRYINIENLLSYVQSSTVPSNYTSGHWVIEPYDGYNRLRNVWQNTYLNVENLTGFAQCSSVPASYHSGQWTLQSTGGGAGGRVAQPEAVQVHEENTLLKVYPNPVNSGRLTIILPNDIKFASVKMIDTQGRVLVGREYDGETRALEVDVTMISKGLYFLSVVTDKDKYNEKIKID